MTLVPPPRMLDTRLRAEILAGRYRAGRQMSEGHLARDFAASRDTVRAALQHLRRIGVVERERHCAAIVPRPDLEEMVDLIELRAGLEPLLVQRFVERATPAQMAAYGAAHLGVDEALTTGDPIAVDEASQHFYAVLMAGASSWALSQTIERENARLTLFRNQVFGWAWELDRQHECARHRRVIWPRMNRREPAAAMAICRRFMVEDGARTVRELRRRTAAPVS